MKAQIQRLKRFIPTKDSKNAKRAWARNWSVLYLVLGLTLVIMDGVFIYQLVSSDRAEKEYGFINCAETVEYIFRNTVDYAVQIATSVSMSRSIEEFLETDYEDPIDYYREYNYVVNPSNLFKMYSLNNVNLAVYANNDTLTNGGGIYKFSELADKDWYKTFQQSGKESLLMFYYDQDSSIPSNWKRRVLYIRKMDYFPGDKYQKLCKVEVNYGTLCSNLEKSIMDKTAWLCQGDRIVVSTNGSNYLGADFAAYDQEKVGYSRRVSFFGNDFDIIVPKEEENYSRILGKNTLFTSLLIIINLIFPLAFIRLGHMIQEGRIKEQEMDIARQNAELLALHSQINPHFLFNALESIRMHSILRGENETAEMVEKLAVIERKNADWSQDDTTVDDEMGFVEAYLKLQQYRFGNRLNYEIDVEKKCKNIKIPRLSIVTFVENACVHGIEGKSSPGWIFVRVYLEGEDMVIEVEDTGEGIDDEELEVLRDKMVNASLDKLKSKGRIGIVNACLRLKMFSEERVQFEIESESGIGTTIQVRIPREIVNV